MSSLIVEVCEIKNIEPHPNADRLEIATVKGWNVIIQKGQYQIGDMVVFIPPDSVLPQSLIEEYQLDYLKNNGRVGTVKLRGFISQGLVLPSPSNREGIDVAKVLGITKYEVPEPTFYKSGKVVSKKKTNPLFDKYTDIENIKNFDTVFAEGEMVVVTEKLHGTNARFGNLPITISSDQPLLYRISAWLKKLFGQKYEFVWGSHNVQKGTTNHDHFYGEDVWGKIAKKYDLANILPNGYIFYGEIVGTNIQDLNYGFTKENELFVFDIKNTETGEYLDWDLVEKWCYTLGLNTVPLFYCGVYDKSQLDLWTIGQSWLHPSQIREGCVIRPSEESNDRRIGRKILKSISPDYILRKGGTEFK